MAGFSKNTRNAPGTHVFTCSCGGEVKMKSIFSVGKMRHYAVCGKCKRKERRPRDFV